MSESQRQILPYLDTHEYMVRSDVDAPLRISQSTAKRILKQMVPQGLLHQDGYGRNSRYRKQ